MKTSFAFFSLTGFVSASYFPVIQLADGQVQAVHAPSMYSSPPPPVYTMHKNSSSVYTIPAPKVTTKVPTTYPPYPSIQVSHNISTSTILSTIMVPVPAPAPAPAPASASAPSTAPSSPSEQSSSFSTMPRPTNPRQSTSATPITQGISVYTHTYTSTTTYTTYPVTWATVSPPRSYGNSTAPRTKHAGPPPPANPTKSVSPPPSSSDAGRGEVVGGWVVTGLLVALLAFFI